MSLPRSRPLPRSVRIAALAFALHTLLIGLSATAGFLLRDLLYLGDILRAPAPARGLALLTTGLLTSLLVGITALLWPKARALFPPPAA